MAKEWIAPMQWDNEGTPPSESLIQSGFTAGYKPPAGVFNYFLNKIAQCIKQLQSSAGTQHGVTTTGNGSAYVASVEGISELKAGVGFVMVPHVSSTSKTPTIDVNNLGAKLIRRRLTNSTSATTTGSVDNWISAGKPVRLEYDGAFWIADFVRPNLADAYGTLPVANGGTGGTTAETARANLGAAAEDHTHSYLRYASTEASMPAAYQWTSVCYGNGTFVAVMDAPESGGVAYSTDGITWLYSYYCYKGNFTSVCYGGGYFVAVAKGGTTAMYSTDGINWSQGTLPETAEWVSVAYGGAGGKRFVAVSSDGKMATSTNGQMWSSVSLDFDVSPEFTYIGSSGNVLVAVLKGDYCIYSSSGTSWTKAGLPVNQTWSAVCWGKNIFMAIAQGSKTAAISSDYGQTWTTETMPFSGKWGSVCYGNEKFVALTSGYTGTGGAAYAYYNGASWVWERATMNDASGDYQPYSSVAYGAGKFAAIIKGVATVMFSKDGEIWERYAKSILQDGVDVTDGIKAALGIE